jgi:hypothetical protein
MEDGYIFRRTAQGTAEIGNRSSPLSPKHRRCLILVDGKATLRDLATSFRPGELGPILRELVERRLLEAPPEGIDAIEASASKIAFIDETKFGDVQSRAMWEITKRLGPAGEPIVTQIGACARPEQLRILLRSVEKALAGALGPDDAKEFVKRIGQQLMGGD